MIFGPKYTLEEGPDADQTADEVVGLLGQSSETVKVQPKDNRVAAIGQVHPVNLLSPFTLGSAVSSRPAKGPQLPFITYITHEILKCVLYPRGTEQVGPTFIG